MEGIVAPLLKRAVKKYLKDRYGNRFSEDDYDRLAEEFKTETTRDEFSALRRSDGEKRRDLVRAIARRIEARVKKTGTSDEKAMMRRFMRARTETSTSSGAGRSGKKKRGKP